MEEAFVVIDPQLYFGGKKKKNRWGKTLLWISGMNICSILFVQADLSRIVAKSVFLFVLQSSWNGPIKLLRNYWEMPHSFAMGMCWKIVQYSRTSPICFSHIFMGQLEIVCVCSFS